MTKQRTLSFAHRVTYEPMRGAPRTPEEILCEECKDSVHRSRAWAIHETIITDESQLPEGCAWCGAHMRVPR